MGPYQSQQPHRMSQLYRAVVSGVLGFEVLFRREPSDQLLVNVQALNIDCALSFKGHEVMEDDEKGLIEGI